MQISRIYLEFRLVAKYNGFPSKKSTSWIVIGDSVDARIFRQTRSKWKGKVCIRAKWLIRPELIPVSVA